MKTALLHLGDKEEITAEDAAIRNEKEGFCPDCGRDVILHVKKSPKGVTHFEHKPGIPKSCKRRYRRHPG
jgi:competence CoiA-like predicted nuclease